MVVNASQSNASDTWMLFESGNCTLVSATVRPAPKDNKRPIDAYIVTECNIEFTRAAQLAAEAILNTAGDLLHSNTPAIVAYSYGLNELAYGSSFDGRSGGLAFAVALAKKLHTLDPGPVAATGEITGGDFGGTVGPIKGIQAKLEAAGQVLPVGGWVIYPKANDREISDRLRQALLKKGLRLRAVSSVQEALTAIFTHIDTKRKKGVGPKKRFKTLIIALTILFCGLALFGYWKNMQRSHSSGPKHLETLAPQPPKADTNSYKVPEAEPGNPQQPLQNPEISIDRPVEINLSGNTILSRSIAELMTSRLSNILEKRTAQNNIRIHLSGRIDMVKIIEKMDAKAGALRSDMTITINDLKLMTGIREKTFPALTVRVKGIGSARTLVPKTVNVLLKRLTDEVAAEKRRRHS
jgi:hypothetical protein